jgi:predicted acetyltransferase
VSGWDPQPVADARERREFVGVLEFVFASDIDEDGLAAAETTFERERSLCVRDGGRVVASSGVRSFALTVPGGEQVPTAGVTAVGVLPTHRRRGIARAMMARQQDMIAERGEPLAALIASEWPIYGRFGYGVATESLTVAVETAHAAMAAPAPAGVRVRLADAGEALARIPPLFARHVAARVGQVTRSDAVWARELRDPPSGRGGRTGLRVAIAEDAAGDARGFALFRMAERWEHEHGTPATLAEVRELVALDDAADAALWGFLLGLDLVREVTVHRLASDDPVRLRLRDGRRARILGVKDWLWVRVIDPPAALARRTWGCEGELVLEVADRFRPASGGRVRLEGGRDGARCTRTDALPDLVLPAWALGAAYLGGTRIAALARAGHVEARDPAALGLADRMFRGDAAPWCSTHF